MKISHEYDDIIELPHHQSCTHPQMSLHDRAAQFAPFAALTGYEDVLQKTREATEEYYAHLYGDGLFPEDMEIPEENQQWE